MTSAPRSASSLPGERTRARWPARRPAARRAARAARQMPIARPQMTPPRGARRSRRRRGPSSSPNTSSLCSPRQRRAALDRPVRLRQVHGQAVDADVAHLGVVRPSATGPTPLVPGSWSMRSSGGAARPTAGTPRPAARAASSNAIARRVQRVDELVELVLVLEPAVERREAARSRAHGSPITSTSAPSRRRRGTRSATQLSSPRAAVDAVRRHGRELAAVASWACPARRSGRPLTV